MKCLMVVVLGLIFILGSKASSFQNDEDFELDIAEEFSAETLGILGKIECKLCKEAMRPVQREVNRESSKEEIKKALDKACTIIPEKRLRGKCRDSIQKRGDKIAEEIAGNLTADRICTVLQYC